MNLECRTIIKVEPLALDFGLTLGGRFTYKAV